MVAVSDLNKNFGRSTDLVKKKQGLADLHTPIHPLHHRILMDLRDNVELSRTNKMIETMQKASYDRGDKSTINR